MTKLLKSIKNIFTLMLVMCIPFLAGYYMGGRPDTYKVVSKGDGLDLELPFEVERRTVTVDEVESKLMEIGELSSYSGEYTYSLGKEEMRYFLEKVPVLGSKNSITLTCDGVVKVGYSLADIVVKVDDDTIYVSIPEAKLNDNYIIWDSMQCKESNNILNPIEFEQYQELIEEIEEYGLAEVTEEGIYQKAEDNLKVLISAFLAEFKDYEIVYME